MQKHYLSFSLILLTHFLAAQTPNWLNYTNDGIVWDVFPTNDHVWISTQGGLERIDRASSQRKIFQPWNSGLRGTDVSAVNLAPDGNLWVSGRSGGLFRFDGVDQWEQFYHINTGDTLIDVIDLEITTEGKLWLISNVNGNCYGCTKLFHYGGTQFSEHSAALEAVLGNNGIRAICLDLTEQLWVSSLIKIVRYDGTNVMDINIPLLTNERISGIGFDRNNMLWASTYEYQQGTYHYRLRYFDGNIWAELSEQELGGELLQTYKMFRDAQGDLYVSFYGKSCYAKYDGISWDYVKISDLPNLPAIPDALLYTVDNYGHRWFLDYSDTSLPKVHEFDGQNWKAYNTNIYPMPSNYIADVAFDCDRNAWLGGNRLTRFDGVAWKEFTPQEIGLAENSFSILSLTYDTAHCNLWISYGVSSGSTVGISKYDGQSFTNYSTDSYNVFETAISKDGTVWAATSSSGLGKFDGNTWTWYDEQNLPVNTPLHHVAIDHVQNVWVSTFFPTSIMRWDGTNWLKFDQNNSPVGFSDLLFVDHVGMVWTSSATGLLRFNGLQWQAFPVPGTGVKGIYSIVQDQAHHFWLSNQAGVHKWDGSTFESYNFIDHPMASPSTWGLRIDPFGNKWLLHLSASGVTVFNENGISNQIVQPMAGVQGTVFYDADQNGQHDPGSAEPGIPNEKVWLQPNNLAVFTNYDGNYTLFPSPGSYELHYTGGDGYTPTTNQTLPLNMGSTALGGFNFGAWAENPEDSITLDLTTGNMRCGSEVNVRLSLTNYGLLEASGDITLQFDPALSFLQAVPAPDAVQGNLLTWHYSKLSLYELLQINILFQVPGVNALGQILSLQSDATVVDGGVVTAFAGDDERAEIRCSFDPNDKAMASRGPSVGVYSLLGDELDFTIRFQNSGNDTAFTVILRDTLDSNLDFSTLQIVSSSHTMRTTLSSDGVLTFVFDDINLLWETIDYAGSQGFVTYRIAPKAALPDPTIVHNTAHIFFDFNPAIVTNTTIGVLVETLPAVAIEEPLNSPAKAVKLYPNPNSGDFWVEWLDEVPAQAWQVSVVDMLGRICFQSSFEQKTARIHDLSPGFFFVFVEKGGKMECHKLVVTKN